jgi:hypothetical protein
MAETKKYTQELVKKEINNLIKFGVSREEIDRILKAKVPVDQVPTRSLNDLIRDTVEAHPNYDFIQQLMTSQLIMDKQSDDNKIYFFNKELRKIDHTTKSKITSLITKFDFTSNVYYCNFEYNPEVHKKIYKDDYKTQYYNLYNPPFWMQGKFYEGEKIPNAELPDIYKKYLKHFTNNHKDSYEYVLDWLANGFKRRNFCILTAIGNQGTGKGVLGQIMKRLWSPTDNFPEKKNVGENYDEVKGSSFKKEFNGFLENKTMFYIDEIKIESVDQEDRVKVLVNDYISVENKGEDARTIKNYASIYVSSNNFDAIRLRADDRRFSVLEMSSKSLLSIFTLKEVIEGLYDPENIRQLGYYLWNREVDPMKMTKVFVTERTKRVREASLKEWEEYFIETICEENRGKKFTVTEASDMITDNFGVKFRPSRRALKKLEELYPNKFKVYKPKAEPGKSRLWHVEFKDV